MVQPPFSGPIRCRPGTQRATDDPGPALTPQALAALHAQCFETPRPWDAATFRDLLTKTGVQLSTLDQAFILTRTATGEAEILTLAVAPARRRRARSSRSARNR